MADEKSILIVDDDLTLLEMYQERFKEEGYIVIGASNGEEALKKVQEDKPAMIILDIMMPKLNGIDVMKRLRENDETKNIPVIILTALVQEVDKLKDLMGPEDGYLVKSEDMPKDVVEKVNSVLQKKRNK